MADDSGFNEVESFDEYNPHPYQGGYDIALTYGRALPPSSATCYPISPLPSPPSVSAPAPSVPAGNGGAPDLRAASEGGEPARGSDSAGEDWGPGYGVDGFRWSEDGYRPGDDGAYLGFWPFPAHDFERRGGRRDSGERHILNCAADYLFGYLRTYGEKRDESYNYGNLNYAYERHHRQEPLLIQFSPQEPSSCGRPSYQEEHQEEVYPNSGYGFSYGGDSPEVTPSEIVFVGSSCSPSSYHEDYSWQVYPQSEFSYAYERCYYEQPLSVQHEQVEHTWSQKPSFPEFYESHVPNPPEDMHAYGSKLYEQPLDMFDFIEKSWHQILNNNDPGDVNSFPPLETARPALQEVRQAFSAVPVAEHDDSWNESEEQSYSPFHKYSTMMSEF